jgi:hypothetical protein
MAGRDPLRAATGGDRRLILPEAIFAKWGCRARRPPP